MRILVVSEDLAISRHRRGIFTFTVGLIHALSNAGHEVFLLCEDFTQGAVRPAVQRSLGIDRTIGIAPAVASSIENGPASVLGEVLDHRLARTPRLAELTKRMSLLTKLTVATVSGRRATKFTMDAARVDYLTPRTSFLSMISGVYRSPHVYKVAEFGAVLGWPTLSVEATGVDLVIVDAPLNIRIRGMEEKTVQVLHDLIPITDPTFSWHFRNRFATPFVNILSNYKNFIFVSNSTRDTFKKFFDLEHVNSIIFSPRADAPIFSRRDDTRYVALIVTGDERKNLRHALEAVSLFEPDIGVEIVGSFEHAPYASQIAALNSTRAGKVAALGYISASQKSYVLAGAKCIVVPSFAEGFGVPIVEGLLHGCAVACSNIPVFKEVAGDSAYYFDPDDPVSIAMAVNTACRNGISLDGQRVAQTNFQVGIPADELIEFLERIR